MLGVAVGFIGPKVGWGRWTTHAVGALFAGLLIPIVAGWAEYPGLSVGETFMKTASGTVNAYLDLAWRLAGSSRSRRSTTSWSSAS